MNFIQKHYEDSQKGNINTYYELIKMDKIEKLTQKCFPKSDYNFLKGELKQLIKVNPIFLKFLIIR